MSMSSIPPTVSTTERTVLHADQDLARQLERTEGAANAAFVSARAKLDPRSGATWTDIAGVYAMYDSPESPLTQTFGLGLFDDIGDAELDRLERFFQDRGAPVHHEATPFLPADLLALLTARNYRPLEFSTVLIRPTTLPAARASIVRIRDVTESDRDTWARTAGEGWSSESRELADFVEAFGRVITRADNVHCFLAEQDGEPIGAAAMTLHGSVALLAGASTIPARRREGVQQALLEHRLHFAADRGADMAMVVTAPGSASQRNAERQGFRVAYTRTKWKLFV
jgi:GNAT superfamily N-acetyltransferase